MKFPPYLANSSWYSSWLHFLSDGLSDDEAIEKTNQQLLSSRDFARTVIEDVHSEIMILSTAIEGGGRKLRNPIYLNSLKLSDHGNWKRTHPIAIDACYGRFPYYNYMIKLLSTVYKDGTIVTLRDFNIAIHRKISKVLLISLDYREINLLGKRKVLKERSLELAAKINPDLSVLDALMRFGPETVLGIFALQNLKREGENDLPVINEI